jgi:pyridoxine 5'-phosphate synthase PdxJ
LPHVEELNIGFAIIARSVFTGVEESVSTMARLVRGKSRVSARRTR